MDEKQLFSRAAAIQKDRRSVEESALRDRTRLIRNKSIQQRKTHLRLHKNFAVDTCFFNGVLVLDRRRVRVGTYTCSARGSIDSKMVKANWLCENPQEKFKQMKIFKNKMKEWKGGCVLCVECFHRLTNKNIVYDGCTLTMNNET